MANKVRYNLFKLLLLFVGFSSFPALFFSFSPASFAPADMSTLLLPVPRAAGAVAAMGAEASGVVLRATEALSTSEGPVVGVRVVPTELAAPPPPLPFTPAPLLPPPAVVAWILVMSLAFLENSSKLSMNSFPASSFREDSGNGTISRQRITCRTWDSVCSGFQSFFKVFTHISPVRDTFGWKIFVNMYPELSVGGWVCSGFSDGAQGREI